LIAGCNYQSTDAYPQTTFALRSDFAVKIQQLFDTILWVAIAVFVVVEGALIWAAIRYRERPGSVPRRFHGHTLVEIAWTAVPAVALGIVLVPSTATIFDTQDEAKRPQDALQIRVIGHQFWWEFEYPTLGIVTANEVHMPVDKPATFEEQSADVIHSFWVPALGGKRDVTPGHVNYLWWTPNATGTFQGQCAELCGYSHANMRMRAFVRTQQEFDAWVRQQQAPAVTPPEGTQAARGAQVFQQRGCGACHTINGLQGAVGQVGPNLTHFASRETMAAGIMENTAANIRTWVSDPPRVKPGALMPPFDLGDEELDALVAYLQSLK
jgi:cytochrome c oxidase subunit 2